MSQHITLDLAKMLNSPGESSSCDFYFWHISEYPSGLVITCSEEDQAKKKQSEESFSCQARPKVMFCHGPWCCILTQKVPAGIKDGTHGFRDFFFFRLVDQMTCRNISFEKRRTGGRVTQRWLSQRKFVSSPSWHNIGNLFLNPNAFMPEWAVNINVDE